MGFAKMFRPVSDEGEEGLLRVGGSGAFKKAGRSFIGEHFTLAHEDEAIAPVCFIHNVAGDEKRCSSFS